MKPAPFDYHAPDTIDGVLQLLTDLDDAKVLAGGQSFIPSALDKLRKVRERIDNSGRAIRLEIDGGVKTDNIGEIAAAGADTFVAGSAIFNAPGAQQHGYGEVIASMKDAVAAARR